MRKYAEKVNKFKGFATLCHYDLFKAEQLKNSIFPLQNGKENIQTEVKIVIPIRIDRAL